MSSNRSDSIQLDISPEAINEYLKLHVSLFLRYLTVRAEEKGGYNELFNGDGRFVLAVKPTDNEETKNLIQEINVVLSHDVIQMSIKDKITKWQPILTADCINAISIDIQNRYFKTISQSNEWKQLGLSRSISEQINTAFCFWITLIFLQKISDDKNSILLKDKVNLLVKLINNINDIPELIEEQKAKLQLQLNNEFQDIQNHLKDKKSFKKDEFHQRLETRFQNVLLENWLTTADKEVIAIQAIDKFMEEIKSNKKLAKKQKIYAELFAHLKSFLDKANQIKPKGFSFDSSSSSSPQIGFFSETRKRSASAPPKNPLQNSLQSELKIKMNRNSSEDQ